MAERAHPEENGFRDKCFGLIKNKYKKKLYERYNFCNRYIKKKVVLDIPCGVGWGTSLLKGATSITGIDISEEAIDYAKKHYERKNRKFIAGNMDSICLEENSIEILICLEGFEHISREIGKKFISESKRILKFNGLLIMTCPVLNKYGKASGNPYHLCEYPENELIEMLNKNFRILSLERIKGPDSPEYRAILKNLKDKKYIQEGN